MYRERSDGVVNVRQHGWPTVRRVVFARDGGCVAPQWRIFGAGSREAGTCRDQYGDVCAYDDFAIMELDHVKETVGGFKPPDDEAHLVTACPWHHRLSQQFRTDSSAHRADLRSWLAKNYPDIWA